MDGQLGETSDDDDEDDKDDSDDDDDIDDDKDEEDNEDAGAREEVKYFFPYILVFFSTLYRQHVV